jgi:hypothetical protein
MVIEGVPVGRDQRLVGDSVRVLPHGCFRLDHAADRVAVGLRGFLPVRPDGVPSVAEAFLVGVAVLGDDRGDAFRLPQGQAEPGRSAVVEDVECVTVQARRVGEAFQDVGQGLEGVGEGVPARHVGLPEAGQVGRDDVEAVSELRDQVPEHVAGAGVAVEQQLGSVGRAGLAVEDLQAVHVGAGVGGRGHSVAAASRAASRMMSVTSCGGRWPISWMIQMLPSGSAKSAKLA